MNKKTKINTCKTENEQENENKYMQNWKW
jgi:hypothetical protein